MRERSCLSYVWDRGLKEKGRVGAEAVYSQASMVNLVRFILTLKRSSRWFKLNQEV